MQIVKETALEVSYRVWQIEPPQATLTVIIKGTFDLVADGVCSLAEKQALPLPETFNEEDVDEPSVRHDSDFAILKPQGECFLAGTAHAPGGAAVTALTVGFSVGAVSKQLAVFGDRQWFAAANNTVAPRAGDPAPFSSLPLSLLRCFGGPGHAENPLGKGIAAGADGWPLPNIEHPAFPLRSIDARPPLGSAFPIPRTFARRTALAGTFDETWVKTRWPYLPVDFDWAYYSAAPEDQRIAGWFAGDEEIVLEHLHPEHPRLVSRLPGLRPRCLLDRDNDQSAEEVTLVLDTVTVDADLLQVFCVWRGIANVGDMELKSVRSLYVAEERLPREVDELRERLAAAVAAAVQDDIIEAETPPEADSVVAAPEVPAVDASWVLARIASEESLANADLSGVDLSGLALDGVDLSGAILSGAKLDAASLRGATLDGAVLDQAHIAGTDFFEASLVGVDLSEAEGAEVNFEAAVLDGATLDRARCPRSRFAGASLANTELVGADLSGASFVGAQLLEADLSEATLDGADFEGADLSQTTLERASLKGARFVTATLTGLRAECGLFTGACFDGAHGEAPLFEKANLDGASFSPAQLPRAVFKGASLIGAMLGGCDLRDAQFARAQLERAGLASSNLMQANFEAANLTQTDLRGANCFAAEFLQAKLDHTLLDGANLQRSKLAEHQS